MRELVETHDQTGQRDTTEGADHHTGGQHDKADLLFLSTTAMSLFEISADDDIYQLIAEGLSTLVPDSVVMVNSYEEQYSTLHLRALRGVGKELHALLKILGKHPIGLSAPIGEEARESLVRGRLERMPAGLYELACSGVRKEVSRGVERLLGSGNLYAMGLAWEGGLCGSMAVLVPKDRELGNVGVIEAFAHQASVALHRWSTERTLRQAKLDLETRVAERTRELTDANRRLRFEVIDRQQAEEKLQKERTTLNKIINLNPYAISTYDAQGRYLQGNQSFLDLFGGPLPADYSLFSDPILEQNGYRGEVSKLTQGEVVSIPELCYNPRSVGSALPDRPVFVRGLAFPVADRDGNVECVVAMHEDITARRQAEEELLLKNSALASSVDAVALANLEGHLTYVNAAFLKLWGYGDENEVIGRPAVDFWEAEEQAANIMAAVMAEGGWRGEAIAMRKDGTAFVAELAASLVGNGAGKPTWLMASFADVTERKRLAEMLRESEELFRGMLGSATVGMYIVQGGRFIYVNQQFETMTGFTIAELSGTDSLQHVHPDDREMVRRKAREQLKGKNELPYEYRFMRKDGQVLWILERVASIVYKGRLAAVGSFMDVTELRLMERELTKSEEKYRSLVETASAGIVATNVREEIEFVNEALCSMTGYSAEELVGRHLPDFLHPDDRKRMKNAFRDALNGLHNRPLLEFRVIHKDGYHLWFQSSPTVLACDDEPVGFTAVVHDVTERKLAEERFRSLVENASDVIVILDGDGTIQYMSPAVERMQGYKPEELVGEKGLKLAHPDDLPDAGRMFAELAQHPGAAARAEVRIRHRDGSWRTIEALGRNLLDDPAVAAIVVNLHDITAPKRVEDALRASEERYRVLVENANDAIIVAQDGILKFFNRRAVEITGYTDEDLAHKPFIELVHPDDRQMVAERHLRRLQGEEFARVYPFRVLDRAGNVRWVEISAVLITWEGKPATLNFLSDITERRNAEEELRQRKERFKVLIENASDAVAIVDADGVVLYQSPSVERMLGYTPEELLGTVVFDFIHPDDLADVVAGLAGCLAGDNAAGGPQEVRLRHKDGSWRLVEGVARNLLDNPYVRGIVANYRDISERHQADEALRESERLYRLVADNATDVIWTMDLKLRFTYVSPSFAKLLGYEFDEAMALTVEEFLTPESLGEATTALAEAMAPDKQGEDLLKSRTLELELVGKDGSRVWTENKITLLLDGDGQRTGIFGVARNITDRRTAAEALRESEEKYRTLLETGATPVYWVGIPDGTITYVNKKAEDLFGRDKEDLVGHMLFEFVPEDEVALHQGKMAEAVATMKAASQPIPQTIVRPDGEPRYTEVYPNMFRQGGKVVAQVVCMDVTERTRAVEALRESEERFRRFVHNAPDIIFRWSVEHGLEYVSPRVLEITGYTAEEVVADPMLGSEIASGIEPDSAGTGNAAAEGATLPSREFAFVRKDGSEAYLEMRPVPIVDDDGAFIGCEGILRDVTERRWAEELLRRSEEFSTSLLANSPSPILVINPDTSVRYVNPALEELTGFAAAELVGTTPPYRWWAEEAVVRAGRDPLDAITRGAQGLEQLCKKKSGERFWIELTATPVVRDGELAYYLATWVDITERKRAGEALHHSEYKYRTALESARDGVLILDTNAMIVDANRMCVASVGYEYKEQLVGRSVFDIVATQAPEEVRAYVTDMLNKQGYITNFEIVARARDGKEIPVEVNMSQLLDERAEVSGSILVIRDVTERKRAQQEILRHAKRLEALHAISASVSQTLDLDEMLNSTLARVLEVVELDGGFVHLLDPEAKELVVKARIGISDEHAAAIERMEVGDEAMQRWHDYPGPAFRTQRILAKEAHEQARRASREDGVVASVSVPLWSKSVMHGGLTLLSRRPRRFSPEELDLLKAIGNEIAVGIENASLLEKTKQLSATDELTGLYNRRQFFEVLESEINRMQRYGGSFTLAMLDLDEFKEYNDRFGHTNGDAVLRCVAQTLMSELRKPDMAFRYGGDEFAIILPETDAEKAKGIVDRVRSRRLEGLKAGNTPSDLRLNFSAGVAQFPDNAETADGLVFLADTALYRSKRSGGNKTILVADLGEVGVDVVDSATMDQVYALAATVDARDPHTYGHSKRVASISEMIGKTTGLHPRELADLRAAALLHDIGKVGVPDSILTKPGVPNKNEWTILRKHPNEGAKIVGYVRELERLVPLVRHHHEWYDGSGYPDGLKGDDIPLGARIISVADAFDTMTTPRPYREVVSQEEACAELRRCSGTQFEGALVEALCCALNDASEQAGPRRASPP